MYNYQLCTFVNAVYFSVGRPKHVRVMAGALEGDVFLGPEAEVIYSQIIEDGCIYLF